MKQLILFLILTLSIQATAQLASFETHATGQNLPFTQVAIGITSPGTGVSRLGHAFLLFMTTEKRFSESYAVEFNVLDLPKTKSKNSEVLSFFGIGKRFALDATSGLTMMNRYRAQNRAILLFPVRLQPHQISLLWEKLKSERDRRESQVLTDYNFISRNCLTEMLSYLNSVLSEGQQKFEYFEDSNNFKDLAVKYLGLPGFYIQNAPYAIAPHIAEHPLVSRKPYVLVPAFIVNARKIVQLEKQTRIFMQECRPQDSLQETVLRIIGQPEIRESQAYLNLLKKIRATCSSPQGQQVYRDMIYSLISLSLSNEALLRLEEALL